MTKLLRLVLPVVIAVALGPLIAGLAFSLVAIAISVFTPATSLPISETWPMFGIYVGFAYVLGWKIALLAGMLVSIWMIRRQPSLMVAVASAVVATSGYMALGATGLLGLVELTNARSNFLFTLVLAVAAAAGCWFVVRLFMRGQMIDVGLRKL